jgi:raffinose/stachyose/melibiose transport system permease protein
MSSAHRRKKRLPILEALLLVAGLAVVAPCALALVNSLKTLPEIIRSPLALPTRLNLDNYAYIFTGIDLAGSMVNSLLMCAAVIAAQIVFGSMAAYSIMRRRMRGARFLRVFFLAGLTIPFQIIMIPLLKEFRFLGITTTYFALWVHYVSWGLPLCIFIYSAFMATIPRDLEEAAAIDGCGPLATFWRIVFPLLAPCTVSIVIFWGLWIWNDFMQAFIIMGANKGHLVFVQLYRFLSDQYVKNWNYIFAGVVVLSAPVTLLYVAMQRRFIKGLTAGSYR